MPAPTTPILLTRSFRLAAPPKHAGLVPFLSLFLLLIVFFLFLNSLSRVEVDRTHRVLGSLSTTFSADVIGPEPVLGPAAGPIAGAIRLQRDLTGLLRVQMTIAGIEIVRLGTEVQVSMPAHVLFRDGEARPSTQRSDFLDWVVSAARDAPLGLRHEVELLMGAADAAQAGLGLPAQRAAGLADALAARGAPESALAAGVFDGSDGTLRLIFRVIEGDAGERR